eukprot:TRINITY_DN74_c0_g1_i1.p1 TRINITY_DN74_c0_g1~~TRINITY_DN74_c0_g1_i1.p1  ORF type:complete len:170 (-),score=40.17 TRINITY_DN74_c0_g1_i1:285-794(-)
MGSGVAELHADTLLQILQSDAANLEETLTSDLLGSIIQINVQKGIWSDPGFRPRFVLQTEQADIDKQLQAWTSLLDRGLSFRKRDLYQLVGAAIPGPNDDVLDPKGQPAQKGDPHGQHPGEKPPLTSGATGGGHEPPVSSKSKPAPTTPSVQPITNAAQRHNSSLTRQP